MLGITLFKQMAPSWLLIEIEKSFAAQNLGGGVRPLRTPS